MRGNIIEELYYGNVDPQDHGYHPKSPVKKASDSLNDLEEKLTEQLADENKTLFLRFCNAYAEFMGESELDTFITGFRHGNTASIAGGGAPYGRKVRQPLKGFALTKSGFANASIQMCIRDSRNSGDSPIVKQWA